MSFAIAISSNAQAVLRQVSGFPARMARAIARAMDKENQLTVGQIASEELSGPRPDKLGVVTNRLRGSVRASKAEISSNTVDSSIGSNVAYAAAHEHGFDGTVMVPAHTRNNSREHTTADGSVLDTKTGRIRKQKPKVIRLHSGTSQVRGHSRHMKVRARHYIQGTLDRSTLAYSVSISHAIEGAWNEGAAA